MKEGLKKDWVATRAQQIAGKVKAVRGLTRNRTVDLL
jgi:hypothetical protein